MWLNSILDTIGNTPLIKLNKITKNLPSSMTAAKRQRAAKRLKEFLDRVPRVGNEVDEAEVESDIQKAVDQVRHGKRKR